MLTAVALSASAADMDFTYDRFGGIQKKYGNNRAETISVAVFVGPELEGKQVTGLYVPVYAQTDKIADISGWTSSKLEYEIVDNRAYNVFDGATAAGAIDGDHVLRVEFDSPVTVPAEGLYVGYTFRATTKLSGTASAMVEGNRKGECFYLASRARKSWTDLYELNKMASAMRVTLAGDFAANDASVVCDEALFGLDTKSFEATVVNNGTEPLRAIDYAYTTSGGISGTGSVALDEEIAPIYGRGKKVAIPLENISAQGRETLTLTITGVNGKQAPAGKTLEVAMTSQLFVPVFRPIVEEYSYLNCGYCPRGYVMLEQMKSKYGSKFVGISYHSSSHESGAMDCILDELKPLTSISGYPTATLNRGLQTDPSSIPNQWISLARGTTTCDISADLNWSDESQTQLVVSGKAKFLSDFAEHSYRIAYILVGDGLSNNRWSQSNYYSNQAATGEYTEPFWDLFVGQPDHITSLVFNDIALAMTDYKGEEGTLPESIEAGKEYEFTYIFNKADIVNLSGQEIVSDYNKVRCIAMIVDSNSGRPANCVSTLYPDGSDPFAPREDIDWTPVIEVDNEPGDSGVAATLSDAKVVERVYYNINGQEVAFPAKGDLLICSEILDNGSVRHSKIIF